MHEMTLLPSVCVNDTPHLKVCTNEKKKKNVREVKLWEGMDNTVVFIETSHRKMLKVL